MSANDGNNGVEKDPELVRIQEDEILEDLRKRMEKARENVDPATSDYVQKTLEFGVAQTRKEYRSFARRNWKAIQKFGTRLIRMFVVLMLILVVLGWFSFNTTQEIQSGRRGSVLEKCHSGAAFDKKLREEIGKLPEPKKAEAESQLLFTEELVSTVVPIGHCGEALRKAGL